MSFRKRPQDYVNQSFKQRLRETPVRELLSGWPKLIIARSTDSIATVFQRLIDHNIFGMPLLDVKTNKYTAFIDLFDILAYLVENNLPIEPNEDWLVNNEFANNSCLMLVGKSLRSAWVLIGEDSSLQAAINQLQTVHRLAVVDSRGNLVGVLSQSRVAKWLAQRTDASIGDFANMSIDDFNFGYCDVQTIHQDEKAVRAFVRMYKNDLSGLAVVDDNDRVVGNISVSDLKGIQKTRGMFRNLFVSCLSFINRNEMPKPPVLVSATRNTSMKEVLERYKDNNIHRVYVVTPGLHKPIGVVTMTDMMSAFATPQTTA